MPLLFVYGEAADPEWMAGLVSARGSVRGTLWTDARHQPVLVLGDGRAPGTLVDADDARAAVLEALTNPSALTPSPWSASWRAVRAETGLRPVAARAWAVAGPREARLLGLRPPRRSR